MRTNNIIPVLLECCSFDAKNPCEFYIIIKLKLFSLYLIIKKKLLYLPNVFYFHERTLTL